MITEEGKRALLGHLSGRYPRWAGGIVIGLGDTATTANDTDLAFPVEVAEVDVVVPEQASQSIIARATFLPTINYKIYEVGLVSDTSVYDIKKVVSFDPQAEFFSGGTPDEVNGRYGVRSTLVSAAEAIVYTAQNQSFGTYTQQAKFSLALNRLATDDCTIRVKIGQDASNYYWHDVEVFAGTGYVVNSWEKHSFTRVGVASWDNVSYIEFDISGVPNIVLDGLTVRSARSSVNSLFVAREKLQTPVQKLSTENMDVEYKVRMNFG